MKSIANYTPKQMEEIIGFIEENFGEGEFIAHETESEYVHTDVNISDDGEMKNLVTFGMGAGRMNAPVEPFERIELVMSASQDIDIIIPLGELVRLSKYPFRNDTWLGMGHTVNFTDDFKKAFGYEYVLLASSSLVFSPRDTTNDVKNVIFLTVVPIYKDEREWIVENNSFVYLDLLYNKFGDNIFKVDVKREHYIPSEEDILSLEEEDEE